MLASDLGEALGCGAHLAALRRTASGGFDVADAVTLEALDAMTVDERERLLLPASVLVAHLPRVELDAAASAAFLHGRAVQLAEREAASASAGVHAVFARQALVGVADVVEGIVRPRRVIGNLPQG